MNVNRLEWFLDMDPIDPATDIRIKRGWNGQETIPNQLVAQLCGKRDNQRDELGAFIVKACNSHADLLEACKALLDEFRSRTALIETCDFTAAETEAIEKAETAIQKAEAQS